ncbi:MAG: Si-specific NAD(P)(+) transhydrogenase [Planctomycetes bacterium]|nr:Si-specific NAD(P)(+) transhydrogenase [Planctomycetota bacterium]
MTNGSTGEPDLWDVVVIGSGPAGQKAAVQAAKVGKRVCVIERDRGVGGACVHRGTIPSKTLRETAAHLMGFRARIGHHIDIEVPGDTQLASLMDRMERVVEAHVGYMGQQLERNGIEQIHGRASFVDPHTIAVESIYGAMRLVRGEIIVIAAGSRPRSPGEIPIDHEHVLDSDSILSMAYLPKSLTVLGGGVIASEYATIFAALGVEVTMVDRAPRPLSFLDQEILEIFVDSFNSHPGCTYLGGATATKVEWDGVDCVRTTLDNGWELKSDKLLFALGRVANLEGLCIEAAGLEASARGHVPVDADCRTAVPHIFAVGDVIGPPALASAAMDQGRRAMRVALDLPRHETFDSIPVGIYTIPEISSIGLDEVKAAAQFGSCFVGRSRFAELARGQIANVPDGLLKLIAAPDSLRVVGCQIIGEGATELVHLAQMAIMNGNDVNIFLESIFNFPTLAEAYRVAALDILGQVQTARIVVAATP